MPKIYELYDCCPSFADFHITCLDSETVRKFSYIHILRSCYLTHEPKYVGEVDQNEISKKYTCLSLLTGSYRGFSDDLYILSLAKFFEPKHEPLRAYSTESRQGLDVGSLSEQDRKFTFGINTSALFDTVKVDISVDVVRQSPYEGELKAQLRRPDMSTCRQASEELLYFIKSIVRITVRRQSECLNGVFKRRSRPN